MSVDQSVWLLLLTAIILANIPGFFPNRVLIFIRAENKSVIVYLAELFLYFILMGILAYLLENRVMGSVASQDWEFYVVTLVMFTVFAFPGFIYKFNLKSYLDKNKPKKV